MIVQTIISKLKNLTFILMNKRIIHCGDAGLGSASIRILNNMQNKAFIVPQSLKKLSKELQKGIFNDEVYKLLSSDREISLKMLKIWKKKNKYKK